MDKKYSLVHLTNVDYSPKDMIYVAANAGYDAVSFRTIQSRSTIQNSNKVRGTLKGEKQYDLVNDRKLLIETKRAAIDTGIIINDTENARIFDGVDIKKYEADLDAAAELGIHNILTNIWTDDKSFYTEKFIELCELALKYEQTVNLEFVTWASVKDMKTAKELLLASRSSNIGIVVDTLHFYRSRVKIEEFDDIPKEWFNYAHLSDCEFEIPTDVESLVHTGLKERLIPGEGSIEIKDIINKIPHVIRGLEIPNIKRINELGYEEYAKYALKKTKMYLNEE